MDAKYIGEEWAQVLQDEFKQPYFKDLFAKVEAEFKQGTLCPSPPQIFQALKETPPATVKVVMIGQDPYHNGHAHGLAFSSLSDERPYSLVQIFKELHLDLYPTLTIEEFRKLFPHNNLTDWAKQGVLLLNRVLTTQRGMPKAHFKWGWETFTEKIIRHIYTTQKTPVVFMCWGKEAQKHMAASIKDLEPQQSRLILIADHPAASAYGGGKFLGCKHFSMTNKFLKDNGQIPIDWTLKQQIDEEVDQ